MSTALELLPDPDVVGAEEYRLVHDYVTELEDQDIDPMIIQAGLDELSRWARACSASTSWTTSGSR